MSSSSAANHHPISWPQRRWRQPSAASCPCLRPSPADAAPASPFPRQPSIVSGIGAFLRASWRLRYARTSRFQPTSALARRPMACPAHSHVPSPWKQRPHRDKRWKCIRNDAVIWFLTDRTVIQYDRLMASSWRPSVRPCVCLYAEHCGSQGRCRLRHFIIG